MTGPRAHPTVDSVDHPLRAALARGERAYATSGPALQHLLALPDKSLIDEAIVAQVRGMIEDIARQLIVAQPRSRDEGGDTADALTARLVAVEELRGHCQALALEWRLACQLERELAVDPILSPLLQSWVATGDAPTGALAMAALAAQTRFVQAQRRMQLPIGELPAELFHIVLIAARETIPDGNAPATQNAEARLRLDYEEAAGRLSLLARLEREAGPAALPALNIEQAGVALWLSALAARSGESRERTTLAVADPHLGRLLLTLRAAGVSPADAEREALRVQPDAAVPRGLEDVGTREAAQWLAEIRR